MPNALNPILLSPRALLSSLASLEALLLLYLFASIYKVDPRFAWLPVDATGLFFALSVLVGSFIIVRNPIHKKALPVVFAMVCLVTWFLVSLLWSPSRIYGPDKVFLMATLVLWAVTAAALIIAPAPERLRRMFTLLLLLATWVGFDAVLFYMESGGSIQRVRMEGGYLGVGRICGLGALVAICGWLYSPGRVARWLCLGLFFGLGFVLAIAGGRGPLLATALPLLLLVGLGIRITPRRILYSPAQLSVLVLLPVLAGGLIFYGAVSEHRLGTLERLTQLVQEDKGGSVEQRREHYFEAGELWSRAPILGHGAGSWAPLTGRGEAEVYPHNLFAELVVEGGFVALFLFLALLGAAFRSVSLERLRRDPEAICAMMLFVNAFLNAMVTANLPGNRAMFMLIGVLALFAVRPVGAPAPAAAPRQPAMALDLSRARRPRDAASGRAEPVKTAP